MSSARATADHATADYAKMTRSIAAVAISQ